MSKVPSEMAPWTSRDYTYNTRMLEDDSVHTLDNTTLVNGTIIDTIPRYRQTKVPGELTDFAQKKVAWN